MAKSQIGEADLRREVSEFGDQFSNLERDQLFVLFFLRAFVTESVGEAVAALCGGGGDKGTDAVLVDDGAQIVFLVQGKYRKGIGAKAEARNDVMSFATLAGDIAGDESNYKALLAGMAPEVAHMLDVARARIRKRGYRLSLFYVTTGRCGGKLIEEAERVASRGGKDSSFQLFDGRQILRLVSDYLDGVAPPVPSLDLELESGRGVATSGPLHRDDGITGIESWIFSMSDVSLAKLYRHSGERLFARNVRGFLGSSEINRGMEATLKTESANFWYYNNGVTIVCDEAKHEIGNGRNILRVTNPQIINGQQTTRTLARSASGIPRASVLVRVIRVPRGDDRSSSSGFDSLVSRIVAATNWQNAIVPSDLMANDRRQIEVERQLRKFNYWYVRKRQTKGETRRAMGSRKYRSVKKEELAQAVAACDLDPVFVREGKEGLFEERLYSKVFSTTDPLYYLTRYRAMREVAFAAKGYPERAYAKWVVLNFVWSKLQPMLKSKANAKTFLRICERNETPLGALNGACNQVFRAALAFYRRGRGKGERAQDVSLFFKRRNLHNEFFRYWRSASNPARVAFGKSWSKFEREFKEAAAN